MSAWLRMPPAAISGICFSMPAARRKASDCGMTFSKSKRGSSRSAIFARAQVAAGQARVLDDDGVGQALLALPLAHQQLHAARVGQDRHQQRLRVVLRQIGQVQRQAGADDHRVDAAFQRARHRRRVLAHRAHHVDGQQPAPAGQRARGADLAFQRLEVGRVDGQLGGLRGGLARQQLVRALHQVGVVAAQVDRRDRAHRAERGHAAGQPVRRHAHAHAALHDRQQRATAQSQRRQATLQRPLHQVAGGVCGFDAGVHGGVRPGRSLAPAMQLSHTSD